MKKLLLLSLACLPLGMAAQQHALTQFLKSYEYFGYGGDSRDEETLFSSYEFSYTDGLVTSIHLQTFLDDGEGGVSLTYHLTYSDDEIVCTTVNPSTDEESYRSESAVFHLQDGRIVSESMTTQSVRDEHIISEKTIERQYNYDAGGQLSSTKTSDASGADLETCSFTWDGGNVTAYTLIVVGTDADDDVWTGGCSYGNDVIGDYAMALVASRMTPFVNLLNGLTYDIVYKVLWAENYFGKQNTNYDASSPVMGMDFQYRYEFDGKCPVSVVDGYWFSSFNMFSPAHVSRFTWDTATSIRSVSQPSTSSAIYSINGTRLNGLQKGVNIIRNADGSTRKVLK